MQKRFLYICKWFLLFSTLIGIFFSNGEGVHLLPFPVSSCNYGAETYYLQEDVSKPYTLSAHNLDTYSVLLKSKAKKNIKQDFSVGALFPDKSNGIKFSALPVKQVYKETELFFTSSFQISSSNRAPPAI